MAETTVKKTATKKTGTAKKKTTTTKKKTTTSSNTMKVSKAEKELLKNYRKCNSLEKQIIASLCEKAAGDNKILDGILSSLTD